MPWKESNKMSQRLDFVGRLFRGERMSDLCREYGISRKTGYKFKERFLNSDPDDWEFGDLSRRPHRSPFATPPEMVELVVAWRERHPTWGKSLTGLIVRVKSWVAVLFSRLGLLFSVSVAAMVKF